jgi:hypothetical protein
MTTTEAPKTAPSNGAHATTAAAALGAAAEKFRKQILGWLPFHGFLWLKLPLAGFAGLRTRALDRDVCEVTVPAGWRTRNPFGSVYFAAHAMAAEMSTGALVLLHGADQGEGRLSTLITGLKADYKKAAKATVTYRCTEGAKIADAVRRALASGEPVTVDVTTQGLVGTEVSAEFKFTWSMKRRS